MTSREKAATLGTVKINLSSENARLSACALNCLELNIRSTQYRGHYACLIIPSLSVKVFFFSLMLTESLSFSLDIAELLGSDVGLDSGYFS
jgi:hypothetical protein